MLRWLQASPSVRYVLPFGAFLVLLAALPVLGVEPRLAEAIRLIVVGAALFGFARPYLDFRVGAWAGSIAVGVGVFAIWIAPELLIPGYRDSVLFRNAIIGTPSPLPESARSDGILLLLRTLRAVALVPVVEELFWRAWLPRWIIRRDFDAVPLGTFSTLGFWLTAILFASEHGIHWDVGLAAGIVFNWWMIRTRSLGDCILAHAVTNGCLAAYVILAGQWQYW